MGVNGELVILYGSQTGTAEEMSWQLRRMAKLRGVARCSVTSMDAYNVADLLKEDIVIFICSTTGLGEEPDNMKTFWKLLLRKNLPPNSLRHLRFGVLGLGDSSYSKFNFPAKKLNKRLLQLGAAQLLNPGLCDYQHDLGHDAVFEPWCAELWKALETYFPGIAFQDNRKIDELFLPKWKISLADKSESESSSSEDLYFSADNANFHIAKPFLMAVDKNERTTSDTHFQDVRLISFSSKDCKLLKYKPGDVFNIRPKNSDELVDKFFEIFGDSHNLKLTPNDIVEITEIDPGPEKVAEIGGIEGGANTVNSQDDEYRWAGVQDPKIMITTSRDPSARLKMFVKELRLIFPNSQRMNRGKYEMKQLIHACRANDVTDFIIVHEHRGVPSSLVVCHLPYGPTAFFQMSDVIMRHDVPEMALMSEQYPHLIFHNFKTDLGKRVMNILKFLFPVPKEDSKRVITFANHDDYVSFRHHTYKKVEKNIELSEVGPRFQLKLYEIRLGTLDTLEAAEKEWVLRPYMNTAVKRRFLSQEDGWQQEDDINAS